MMKTKLGMAAIAAVALVIGPAQAAKVVAGCSESNLQKTESAVDAMADGNGRSVAQQEVAAAQEAKLNGDLRQCAVHLSRAMHDTQAQGPHNSFAQAPGETQGQTPGQNQWNWKPLQRGE